MSLEEVCKVTMDMLNIAADDPMRVFLLLRRDNFSGATHDYRFPILPFGAYYLNKYIEHLKSTHGDDRFKSDRYLFSDDPEGKKPLDAKMLKEYCDNEIKKYTFGYAALAKIPTSRTPKVITLLHNTYDTRLAEACRLSNDRGAMLFMKHMDLSQSVQADCYRSFTDITGMDYLYRSTCRDQRGVPPTPREKRIRSTRTDKETQRKITKLPADHNGFATTAKFTLQGLKAGDIVTIDVKNGCFVSVLPPE